MTKNYVLPSGTELTLNHLIVIPEPDVYILTTDFYLNCYCFGEMVAYSGTIEDLSKITNCFELNIALKNKGKYHYEPDDIFTIITDFKIERDYVFDKPTYYIFNKLFDYINDIGIYALHQVYANIVLINSDILDEAVEDIHRTLTMGLDAYVVI